MPSTNFQDYNQNTPIVASWLNDVNGVTYTLGNTKNTSAQIAAGWVRFVGASGGVTQSTAIANVARNGVGNYTITYTNQMQNSSNCYSVNISQAGVWFVTAETVNSVTIQVENLAGGAFDPTNVGVVIFGVR